MDWGALLPFCRAHTAKGTVRQEPWSFGREVEAAARRMLKLRMELMPYLYSAFVESSETGLPVARPLWMGWPRDPQCREIGDQFLLGADILVAPVLQPGIEHRAVYLPEGEWYPLEGGEPMKGRALDRGRICRRDSRRLSFAPARSSRAPRDGTARSRTCPGGSSSMSTPPADAWRGRLVEG